MPLRKIYLLLFCAILCLTTCKKYPEGGFLRQGQKTFITSAKTGFWKLKLFEVNNIDSTGLIPTPITFGNDYFNDFLSCGYIDKKRYKEELFCSNHNYNYLANFINKGAQITFENIGLDNVQCQNTSSGVSCQRNILNPEGIGLVTFTILKLKDKECILTTTLKNNYKIVLTR